MRCHWLIVPMLALAVGCSASAEVALGPDAGVDPVLEALHDAGQRLQSFTADVSHAETNTTMGTTTTRTGTVVYQVKPDGDARLRIVFDRKAVNEKPPHPDRVEYLLNDGWLAKRDYPSRTETDYQVSRPGEKVNLFQLGKGPFPLPIGQDPKSVRDAFDVTRVPAAADDPAGSVHLKLTPKPTTELARKFSQIDVWVDRTQKMPVRIETQAAGNDSTDRQTVLHNLHVNPLPPPGDSAFTPPPIEKSWSVSQQPLDQ